MERLESLDKGGMAFSQKELLKAYQASKDTGTRTRYRAVRLYGEGYAEKEIEQITGCSRTSLMEWCRAYRADHSQGLVDHRVGGNSAKLGKMQIEELQQKMINTRPGNCLGQTLVQWTVSFGQLKI